MPQDWFNPFVRILLRSPLHAVMSGNTMLVTYTGRKSGKEYTLPINYLRQGDALNAISSRSRTWWRNLRGGTDVTLLLQRKQRKAHAEVREDQETIIKGLKTYLVQAPQVAKYFGIELDSNGNPDDEALSHAASERVLITFHLTDS